MTMTDPLADMLTRIRNGQGAHKETVRCSFSRLRMEVLRVLKEEGYITDYRQEKDDRGIAFLEITLKYFEGAGVIQEIARVSRPGRRVYCNISSLPHIYSGLGTAILSTSSGVMSDAQAREQSVGGEFLCRVF